MNAVNLDVADGTIHALVGPNGAGKTTLFNLLTGFLTPTSGQILLRGDDIAGQQPEQIAHLGVARSFQITSLFEQMTLLEHLELALASPTGLGYRFWTSRKKLGAFRERSMELLSEVGLADRAGSAPARSPTGRSGRSRSPWPSPSTPPCCCSTSPRPAWASRTSTGPSRWSRRSPTAARSSSSTTTCTSSGSLADQVTVLQSGEVLAEGTYDEVRGDERVITAYLGESGDAHG